MNIQANSRMDGTFHGEHKMTAIGDSLERGLPAKAMFQINKMV
jgi:hypothetical protein